ncbi:hypothetical protein BDY21DRAFT_410360 [Lineolata rhizophorae]|uniref:Fe2OG dioxygenase domain-containing protein n=1 Tax=Lineolata rhizophorae TaxID=578093 RepID=A0A6A6P376_9PEZI|nr:hypothetical protein BDY21DRAFT_410360 [Lineolata rhizophorae]
MMDGNETKSNTVPVVDFGPFLDGKGEDKQRVAKEIDNAFKTVGFVCLVNYGIKQEEVDKCFEWSRRFFDLPMESKMLAPHPPTAAHHRGYSGVGLEKASHSDFDEKPHEELRQTPDVKESYEIGNEEDEMQPNIWIPEEVLPGFRDFMNAFFGSCTSLTGSILHSLALALSLEPTRLSAAQSRALYQLRLLHYPSVPASLLRSGAATRIGAHADFGTLTLLFQDGVGGLEIERREGPDGARTGEFVGVPAVPGGVLVNVGDLMERWSNGRWKSTVHRVGLPPTAGGEGGDEVVRDRYSIPFFSTADPETVIECLPGCSSEEDPPKYEPVTAWGYINMRMQALYS